jgi:hypothetical protein
MTTIHERVRAIALALPGVDERLSHGAPCFFVRRRPICYLHDHHADDRVSVWCPVERGTQAGFIARDGARFFAPTPSANGVFTDWIGIYVDDANLDWAEVAEVVEDAFRLVAPASVVAQWDRTRP